MSTPSAKQAKRATVDTVSPDDISASSAKRAKVDNGLSLDVLKKQRVIVLGRCCTGKTTICHAIAKHLGDVTHVEESGETRESKDELRRLFMQRTTKTLLVTQQNLPSPAIRVNTNFWIITSPIYQRDQRGYFPAEVAEASQNLKRGVYLLYWEYPEEAFTYIYTKQLPGTYEVVIDYVDVVQFIRKLPERCSCFDRQLPVVRDW
jgi:ABC-type dipeptide/oligopeptide/nickel transport system ATPase component